MRTNRLNLALGLGLILATMLACNFSFSTANISSLKLSKDKGGSTETTNFSPTSAIYAIAVISNTSDKHKVKCRLLYDDVQGGKTGAPVPGAETTLDVPGSNTATFTFTPAGGGWPKGRYKVEVTMTDESGEQKDQETADMVIS